jgi:hypothetical protein
MNIKFMNLGFKDLGKGLVVAIPGALIAALITDIHAHAASVA